MLKTFVCRFRCVAAGGNENLPLVPYSFLLLSIIFYFFNSPGIGAKKGFPHFMPAGAREEKGVNFKFKCCKVNIQPPHPSF